MRTLLKHTLIFNVFDQNLVLSDAQVLNNNTFRILARTDEDVQQFIVSQMLSVAVRADADRPPPHCNRLVETFKAEKKYLFDAKRLGEGDELDFIWENATILPFDRHALAKRYAEDTIATFSGPLATQTVPERLRKNIVELSIEERLRLNAEGKELGWIFFHQDLANLIDGQDWTRYGAEIDKLAMARYQTNLPQFLNADAVYSEKHANAFEIIRGVRQRATMQESRMRFQNKLGLAAYERGIALLRFDDIIKLLDTDEAAAFAASRNQIDTSAQSVDTLNKCLRDYIFAIERSIINREPGLKHESAEGNEHETSISFEKFAKAGNKVADFLGIFCAPLGVASYVINRLIFDKFFEQREQDRRDQIKAELLRHMEQRDEVRALFETDNRNKVDADLIRIQSIDAADENYEIEVYYK